MAGKFLVSKGASGKFHFVLKAGNGEVILASQMYESAAAALNGVASVKENGPKAERYERLTSKSNDPYFNLKAGNGQVIGKSEMYSSERARDNGIESVMKNSADAKVDDQTAA
jgi:uncharacterized protein